jgi:hypothetical protein
MQLCSIGSQQGNSKKEQLVMKAAVDGLFSVSLAVIGSKPGCPDFLASKLEAKSCCTDSQPSAALEPVWLYHPQAVAATPVLVGDRKD